MNNEETILDPQAFAGSSSNNSNASTVKASGTNIPSKKDSKTTKGNSTTEKIAYAAGGFVAGAASMVAGDAMAAQKNNEEVEVIAEEQPQVDPAQSPSEHEAIIASDEGLRVAHVDDSQSFDEAFADARAQVGPGGVFEWHGKVYGTFYNNEWDQMSAEERAEWQSKVDYNDLREESEAQQYAQHHDAPQHATAHNQSSEQATNVHQVSQSEEAELTVEVVDVKHVDVDGDGRPDTVVKLDNGIHFVDTTGNGEADIAMADLNGNGQLDDGEYAYVSDEHIAMPVSGEMYASETQPAEDTEIHVLEVGQADLDGNGMAENVALVEIDGNEVMLVDIDQDNVADVIIADLNGDGQIQGNEVGDISDQGLDMPTMSDGDMYMAQADSEPDYTNDADMGLYEA